MKIIHKFKNKKIENESDDPGFIITNRNGSYFSAALNNSRYDGFFIFENEEMYKILDEIIVNRPINALINKFSSIALERENLLQDIHMFKNFNSLVCLFDKFTVIELLLDVKKSYDNRNFGRYYKVYEEDNKIIVHFDKKTSGLENEPEGRDEYSMYIVINIATYSTPGQWIKRAYSYDKSRNSLPYERHIYHGLKTITKKLIISASLNKNKAIKENDFILKNLDGLTKKHEKYISNLLNKFNHKNKEIDFSLKCSTNALDQLTADQGILAGLPWFFQYWARDELFSLKACSLFNKSLAIQVLNKHTETLVRKGNIYSNKYSNLTAKDATPLLALRADEIKNGNYKIILYLNNPVKYSIPIENNALETWMDTASGNDNRSGVRIEIQAMYLRVFSILYGLTKDKRYKDLEKNLTAYIRKNLFRGKKLKDGLNDETTRPNIFLAYYFYPDLLSKKEWITTFNSSLPNIWNNWGGFSSIEKSSPLFQPNYTGE
ncbi:hypothetical protein HYX18_04240, partial [Candidatus Woesearchaeota archaeon]|nr:hypothetical protein [Candidatus Woesearchaeota archaeon]